MSERRFQFGLANGTFLCSGASCFCSRRMTKSRLQFGIADRTILCRHTGCFCTGSVGSRNHVLLNEDFAAKLALLSFGQAVFRTSRFLACNIYSNMLTGFSIRQETPSKKTANRRKQNKNCCDNGRFVFLFGNIGICNGCFFSVNDLINRFVQIAVKRFFACIKALHRG